ncbi:MAG: CDP-alcohol phosphatidyltransferase family protein [Candidatus Aureabacteria bacterium]|nr:CDP-alcohol phosphatidyltransferase family protein [Candidatus Auribacterota bacterium]
MKNRIIAWVVHAYTALGVITGILAIRATLVNNFRSAFAWLAVAIIIDSTDGALARRFRTAETIPSFNGRRLDDIVDYFNYVIVPVLILVQARLLPAGGWGWAIIPALASAYGFCQEEAKTDDHFFLGFPSYWNIVVMYLYFFAMSPAINLLIVITLSLLIFVPIKYIDPFKTGPLRRITRPFSIAWAVAALLVIARMPAPGRLLVEISFVFPCYYLLASFWLNLRGVKP